MWQNKKARCCHTHLIKHKKAVGVGIVDLANYYYAFILTQLKFWFHPSPDTLWVHMESALSGITDLKALLIADIWCTLNLVNLPPTVQASIRAWRKLTQGSVHPIPNSDVLTPLSSLDILIPHLLTKSWSKLGIQ